MKNRFSSWTAIAIIAAVGILFIIYSDQVNLLSWLVRAIGIILLVPGIITLMSALHSLSDKTPREKEEPRRSPATDRAIVVVSAADIAVALWMLIAPAPFEHLIVYLFAAALFIYGIYTFVGLIYFSSPVKMPWPFYIMPSLAIVAGLIIIFTPLHTITSTVTLVTGIMLVVIAVNSAIQVISYSRDLKRLTIPADHQLQSPAAEETSASN